jgi:three-Cys-motif partner protein
MPEPVLWPRDDHTAAKHQVLRAYLDGWIPVMAQQSLKVQGFVSGPPRLLLVDGFAGPGRYSSGESGSPLIMLDALVSHAALERFDDVEFTYLFIEHDRRRVDHLRGELNALGTLPGNVTVRIEPGEFEATFGRLLDQLTDHGRSPIPTFAFIDPFGYSTASMSLTGRLLAFKRCEVLIFLPLSFVHRFAGRAGQDAALTSLYGCDDWREVLGLDGAERREFLLRLFEHRLGLNPSVAYVRSFRLRTDDGNDYRLVFGVGHDKGLDLAKDAMWKVDPIAGTSYTATTGTGQEVLFTPDDSVDTTPLLRELRATFATEWFSIDDAERVTRVDTPFRIAHLRRRTLDPAAKAGTIKVQRPGRSGFKDARIRFAS